jgi:chromosome segregation ATPase
MGVMFAEDVSLLRSELELAKEAQLKADADRTQAVDVASKERSRADEAELITAQLRDEIVQLRHQLSDLRGQAASVPVLRSELEDLASQVKALTEKLLRAGEGMDRTKGLLRERTQQLSEARASITSLSSELDPSRKILEAIGQWKKAQDAIWKELG